MTRKEIAIEMSWAELLEEKSRRFPDRVILVFEDTELTYRRLDEKANKIANLFLSLGGCRGKGVALFMNNSPDFLHVFAGSQKIGMYSIPKIPRCVGKVFTTFCSIVMLSFSLLMRNCWAYMRPWPIQFLLSNMCW